MHWTTRPPWCSPTKTHQSFLPTVSVRSGPCLWMWSILNTPRGAMAPSHGPTITNACLRAPAASFGPAISTTSRVNGSPSIDGLADMLTAGAHVLDVGCGVGYSSVLIAEAFPTTTVTGVDYHAGSIELASENARTQPLPTGCHSTSPTQPAITVRLI